jgi:hypothetical protein
MSEQPNPTVVVPGVRFTMTFYFVCPENHVHACWLQFRGIDPESMTTEHVAEARDMAQKHMGNMRLASEEEIEVFESVQQQHYVTGVALPEQGHQTIEHEGRQLFVMPGPKEPQ